jgi:hypothetical protein
MEEEPGNEQPDPDHEAEQAHEIDCGEFADAILPELPEIGEDAEKKVRVKKMTRKTLASPIAGVSLARVSGEAVSARARPTRNVTTNPMMNFGKRCQISTAFAVSPARTLI